MLNSGDGYDFRPLAALGRPHGQAPFFALTKVPPASLPCASLLGFRSPPRPCKLLQALVPPQPEREIGFVR